MNIADYLFDRSRYAANTWPKGLAEIFEFLIWTMDDHGGEIMGAIESWLLSEDRGRVQVALEIEGSFPFTHQEEMEAALSLVKARWPDLAEKCDDLIERRSSLPSAAETVPQDVEIRVAHLKSLIDKATS